jgi:hypothetical protein
MTTLTATAVNSLPSTTSPSTPTSPTTPTTSATTHTRSSLNARHVYHVSPWRQLVPWILFLPLAVPLAFAALLVDATSDRAALWVASMAFMTVILCIFWMIRRARLEIGPDGIVLKQIGFRFESPWSNVVAMRLDRGHEGFVTTAPVAGKGASTLAVAASMAPYAMYDGAQQSLLDEQRLIPIEAFAWYLRNGMMAREIRRFAPHLASDLEQLDAKAVKSAQPTAKVDGRSLWIVAGIAAVPIGLTALLFTLGDDFAALLYNTVHALVDPFLVASSAAATWQMMRRRSWLLTALTALMTLVMICWTLLDWARLFG